MYITENRLLKWGIAANAIYVFLFFIFKPDGIGFQKVSISLFLMFSVISLFFLSFKNKFRLKLLPKSIRLFFFLLMMWSIGVIVRSFSLSIQDWITNFGNVYMALAWLMPLVMILGLKIENWRVVFKSINFMFSLMIFAFLLLPFIEPNDEWIWLLRPIYFVLLLGVLRYRPLWRLQIYAIIGIFIYISMYTGKRTELLFFALVLGFLILDKLLTIKLRKSLLKYIIFMFLTLFIFVFTVGYEHVSNFVSSIIDFQDSRTFLFNELMQELNFKEKIIGRGSLGTYYSQYMEHTKWYTVEILKQPWWGDSSTRISIEVGYLQMILKGGFILALINLFFFTYSSYVAIFKSNSKFIRRLGYFILGMTIISLIEFRPVFTPIFILLWMSIGTVLNAKYREMNDEEIESLISIR